jgi:hypothetical protein
LVLILVDADVLSEKEELHPAVRVVRLVKRGGFVADIRLKLRAIN